MTILLLAAMPLGAQNIKLPEGIEKLAGHAEESVNVTLDGPLLQLASRFISDRDGDDAKVKMIVAQLQGIYVRSFQFASEGEYNPADVDAVRAQYRTPEWSRIVGVKSRGDGNADVFFKVSAEGKLGGIAVIAADPRELTIVNIVGTIDPAQLGALGGEFGIPKLDFGKNYIHWGDGHPGDGQ